MRKDVKRKNPYLKFLEDIQDGDDDPIQIGLDTWLGAIGPMVIPQAVSNMRNKKQWETIERTEEDLKIMNVHETMNRISGNFCSWLRKLPGDDKTVNDFPEASISKLFDISQAANPATTKLGKGLRSWAKFGSAINVLKKPLKEENTTVQFATLLENASMEESEQSSGPKKRTRTRKRSRQIFSRENKWKRMISYGAWYLDPRKWHHRFVSLAKASGDVTIRDQVKGPCTEKSSKGQGDVRLPVMKAFGEFLGDIQGYKKPKFLLEILKTGKQ